MEVAGCGAAGMAAVPMIIGGIAAQRVKTIRADQFIGTKTGVGLTPAMIDPSSVWVVVRIAFTIRGGKGEVLEIDASVNDSNNDALASSF